LVWIVEPKQKSCNSGLAGSTGADKCDRLAGFDCQIEVVKERSVGAIGIIEEKIFESDFAL